MNVAEIVLDCIKLEFKSIDNICDETTIRKDIVEDVVYYGMLFGLIEHVHVDIPLFRAKVTRLKVECQEDLIARVIRGEL